jgi:NTE family protein
MMSRRRFLGLTPTFPWLCGTWALAESGSNAKAEATRIGLALGGGGAKGLAHIPVLELLDELGLRPHRIAGTSIGSVMGALYASGLSGREIRDLFDRLFIKEADTWREIIERKDLLRWLELIDLDLGDGGLVGSDTFLDFLGEAMAEAADFEALKIPLSVVASSLWTGEQVVMDSGDLLKALKASIAVPGLFAPVPYEGRHLIDGGVANPVPYDLLLSDCDLVLAVDVLGQPLQDEVDSPSLLATVFASFTNMQRSILNAKLERQPPHILVRPDLVGIRVLEFHRAEEIYRQAGPSIESARQELREMLGTRIRPAHQGL